MTEYVTNIPVEKLKPFPDHPFQVRDDDSMNETVESIKTYGVLQPVIVRPTKDGDYEILSGHRRKRACELAGRKTIPAIVRELDDDAAIIFIVDSNLQRENILPSERAAAYKMKLEALKRQGIRNDLTCDLTCTQVEYKLDYGKKSVERLLKKLVRVGRKYNAMSVSLSYSRNFSIWLMKRKLPSLRR